MPSPGRAEHLGTLLSKKHSSKTINVAFMVYDFNALSVKREFVLLAS